MATVRLTASALLDTVTQTAAAVGNIVSSVGSGAAAINDFADNLRQTQLTEIKAAREGLYDRTVVKHTLIMLQSHDELDAYLVANPHQQSRCDEITARLKKALA